MSLDRVPAEDRLTWATSLASGSTQWRQVAATWPLMSGAKGATATLGIDTGSGSRDVTVTYGAAPPPPKRPGPMAEIEPGLWYVDLTRVKMDEVSPKLAALAAARGVVFDVRGYPTDSGFGVLPHLLAAAETDRWMHVAKIIGPFYETAGWLDFGWDVKPANPHIGGKVVFLTDGGAISYAESVMGYVADRKLGTIVGDDRRHQRERGLLPHAGRLQRRVHRHEGHPARRPVSPPPGGRRAGCARGTDPRGPAGRARRGAGTGAGDRPGGRDAPVTGRADAACARGRLRDPSALADEDGQDVESSGAAYPLSHRPPSTTFFVR